MALEYKLVPDPTPHNPNRHKAEVINQKEVTLDEVIDLMIEKESITMSRKEVKATVESYLAGLHLAHIDGKTLSTPLIDVTEAGLEPGPKLRKMMKKMDVRKNRDKNA